MTRDWKTIFGLLLIVLIVLIVVAARRGAFRFFAQALAVLVMLALAVRLFKDLSPALKWALRPFLPLRRTGTPPTPPEELRLDEERLRAAAPPVDPPPTV